MVAMSRAAVSIHRADAPHSDALSRAERFCSIVVEHANGALPDLARRLAASLPFVVAPLSSFGFYAGEARSRLLRIGGFGAQDLLARLSERALLSGASDLSSALLLPGRGAGIGSLMSVPVIASTRVLGLLALQRSTAHGEFSRSELAIVTAIGRYIAEQLSEAGATPLPRQAHTAIPQAAHTGTAAEGDVRYCDRAYQVAAAYRPATEPTGVFYDIAHDPSARCVAVMGRAEADSESELVTEFRAVVARGGGALDVVSAMSRCRGGVSQLVCVALDRHLGSATISNWGHPPPFIRWHATAETEIVASTQACRPIGPGDSVVLFSDGVRRVLDPHPALTPDGKLAFAIAAGAHNVYDLVGEIVDALESAQRPNPEHDLAILAVLAR